MIYAARGGIIVTVFAGNTRTQYHWICIPFTMNSTESQHDDSENCNTKQTRHKTQTDN